METMKVAMYYNNNDVRIEEQPIPEIQEDEFLLKVKSSGICGSDVMEWYRIKKAPRVLGHEVAGEIVKIGSKVKKFKTGDRVFVTHHVPCNTCRFCLNGNYTLCETLHSTNFYPGGFAEYIRIPPINVDRGTFLLPDEISYDEGTFIEPLGCIVRGFRIADFKPAKTILIIGSGIAGLLAIKLAKVLGSSKIFATDINDYRVSMAKKMGADTAINAREDIYKIIRRENDGRLADYVILCTGALSAAEQSFKLVEPGGTLLLFAPTKPGDKISLELFDIWNKQIKIVSTYAAAGLDLLEAIELIRSKKVIVEDMITHRLSLEDAQRGFQLVAEADKSIKVILKP